MRIFKNKVMSKLNFNSAICTSREQSERLLALGIKMETADMCWTQEEDGFGELRWFCRVGTFTQSDAETFFDYIPAWSLHRLIELCRKEGLGATLELVSLDQTYDKYIGQIKRMIKEGYFNKEYLCEK